jgi:hypothetical protein
MVFSELALLLAEVLIWFTGIPYVGGFSPDIEGFGLGCMSGLKLPTYNFFDP